MIYCPCCVQPALLRNGGLNFSAWCDKITKICCAYGGERYKNIPYCQECDITFNHPFGFFADFDWSCSRVPLLKTHYARGLWSRGPWVCAGKPFHYCIFCRVHGWRHPDRNVQPGDRTQFWKPEGKRQIGGNAWHLHFCLRRVGPDGFKGAGSIHHGLWRNPEQQRRCFDFVCLLHAAAHHLHILSSICRSNQQRNMDH